MKLGRLTSWLMFPPSRQLAQNSNRGIGPSDDAAAFSQEDIGNLDADRLPVSVNSFSLAAMRAILVTLYSELGQGNSSSPFSWPSAALPLVYRSSFTIVKPSSFRCSLGKKTYRYFTVYSILYIVGCVHKYQLLVGFGLACAPVRCAHPSFWAHCHAKRGAARPRPSQLRCFIFIGQKI
jgi:hypothetical protein